MSMNKMTTEQLRWTLRDLTNVIVAQEAMVREGHTCPKLGKYESELKSR